MMPPGLLRFPPGVSAPTSQDITNGDAYSLLNPFTPSNAPGNNAASAYLSGAGTFLGIAQQSSDNPMPNDDIVHFRQVQRPNMACHGHDGNRCRRLSHQRNNTQRRCALYLVLPLCFRRVFGQLRHLGMGIRDARSNT